MVGGVGERGVGAAVIEGVEGYTVLVEAVEEGPGAREAGEGGEVGVDLWEWGVSELMRWGGRRGQKKKRKTRKKRRIWVEERHEEKKERSSNTCQLNNNPLQHHTRHLPPPSQCNASYPPSRFVVEIIARETFIPPAIPYEAGRSGGGHEGTRGEGRAVGYGGGCGGGGG